MGGSRLGSRGRVCYYSARQSNQTKARMRPGGSEKVEVTAGEIVALVGMGVLLLNNLGRRRVRQGRPPVKGRLAKLLDYGDYVAFGIILVGLVVIILQK